MIIPALLFGVYRFANDFKDRNCSVHLPHREWMLEHKNNIEAYLPLEKAIEKLKKGGKSFIFVGDGRYPPMYIYEEEEPFRLNHFHYFDKEETLGLGYDVTGTAGLYDIYEHKTMK